jgi:hypothetical protein
MKPPYGLAAHNLMQRLVPGRSKRAEQGVRRRPLPARPTDQPTEAIQALPAREQPEHSTDPHPTVVIESLPCPEPQLQLQTAPPAAHPAPPPQPAPVPSDQTVYISAIPDKPIAVCAVLVGIEGPLEGEVYKIRDGANKLGRSDDCDVVLESVRISRLHAQIHHEDGAFVVEANAEVMENNPTLVNGSEIDAEGLFDGDVLTLGDSSFAFRSISKRNPAAEQPVH